MSTIINYLYTFRIQCIQMLTCVFIVYIKYNNKSLSNVTQQSFVTFKMPKNQYFEAL